MGINKTKNFFMMILESGSLTSGNIIDTMGFQFLKTLASERLGFGIHF